MKSSLTKEGISAMYHSQRLIIKDVNSVVLICVGHLSDDNAYGK